MGSEILVRGAKFEDAKVVADGWSRSIREVCGPAYNNDPELIQVWAGGKTPAFVRKLIQEDDLFVVAEYNGDIAGIGSARFEMEMAACYVWPEFLGHGIGRAILKEIERAAVNFGIEKYRIFASFNAVGFYQQMGYKATGEVQYCGKIGSIVMEKSLMEGMG